MENKLLAKKLNFPNYTMIIGEKEYSMKLDSLMLKIMWNLRLVFFIPICILTIWFYNDYAFILLQIINNIVWIVIVWFLVVNVIIAIGYFIERKIRIALLDREIIKVKIHEVKKL
ncbi:MAG: hypothetical protein KHZ15_02705 [Coprobacillus cateniformis]|uniref:hypothetical protein n=1 Tax=Longibaculum muris TaxID=1796628 RepID=UPI003AB4BA29|nr:hypothetical protein [Coprobacillus cateniformis]